MKCPSCSTVLVIKTDPKNTDYEYVEGIRKKDMAFDPEEAQTQRVQDSEVSRKLAGEHEEETVVARFNAAESGCINLSVAALLREQTLPGVLQMENIG